jgi:hypothetical protein
LLLPGNGTEVATAWANNCTIHGVRIDSDVMFDLESGSRLEFRL